jgi:hypothetical protein
MATVAAAKTSATATAINEPMNTGDRGLNFRAPETLAMTFILEA